MISKEALEEFKKIWRKEFKKGISDKKAIYLATNLLTLMNVIYRPIKKEWLKGSENKDKTKPRHNGKSTII